MPGPLFGGRRWLQRGLGRRRCSLDGQDALGGQGRGHGGRIHARRQAVATVELARDESVLVLESRKASAGPPLPAGAPPLAPAQAFWPAQSALTGRSSWRACTSTCSPTTLTAISSGEKCFTSSSTEKCPGSVGTCAQRARGPAGLSSEGAGLPRLSKAPPLLVPELQPTLGSPLPYLESVRTS